MPYPNDKVELELRVFTLEKHLETLANVCKNQQSLIEILLQLQGIPLPENKI